MVALAPSGEKNVGAARHVSNVPHGADLRPPTGAARWGEVRTVSIAAVGLGVWGGGGGGGARSGLRRRPPLGVAPHRLELLSRARFVRRDAQELGQSLRRRRRLPDDAIAARPFELGVVSGGGPGCARRHDIELGDGASALGGTLAHAAGLPKRRVAAIRGEGTEEARGVVVAAGVVRGHGVVARGGVGVVGVASGDAARARGCRRGGGGGRWRLVLRLRQLIGHSAGDRSVAAPRGEILVVVRLGGLTARNPLFLEVAALLIFAVGRRGDGNHRRCRRRGGSGRGAVRVRRALVVFEWHRFRSGAREGRRRRRPLIGHRHRRRRRCFRLPSPQEHRARADHHQEHRRHRRLRSHGPSCPRATLPARCASSSAPPSARSSRPRRSGPLDLPEAR